ncbi:MAG: hypothetical protein MMC23_004848 [Stictis urceolatum]|nr:hypothetical protein [Stictis urceolata]
MLVSRLERSRAKERLGEVVGAWGECRGAEGKGGRGAPAEDCAEAPWEEERRDGFWEDEGGSSHAAGSGRSIAWAGRDLFCGLFVDRLCGLTLVSSGWNTHRAFDI